MDDPGQMRAWHAYEAERLGGATRPSLEEHFTAFDAGWRAALADTAPPDLAAVSEIELDDVRLALRHIAWMATDPSPDLTGLGRPRLIASLADQVEQRLPVATTPADVPAEADDA